jgi:DNA-binding NtrC family response regulator
MTPQANSVAPWIPGQELKPSFSLGNATKPEGTSFDMGIRPAAGRVLLVDDEALIRWALGETLTEQGYQVEQAASRKEVLEILDRGEKFEVILLDLRLPDSSDLQLLSRLRTLMPATPIILMTAFATPETVQSALDMGVFRVVNKPFEIGEIMSLVKRAH